MRTDVKVRTTGKVRIPNIPIGSAGRAPFIERGDFVLVDVGSHTYYGRVIGFVTDTADNDKDYIVIVTHTPTGSIWEQWVEPHQVLDASYSICGLYESKMRWFYSKDFLQTPTDIARSAGTLPYESIEPTFVNYSQVKKN